jgi:hypothetical protein
MRIHDAATFHNIVYISPQSSYEHGKYPSTECFMMSPAVPQVAQALTTQRIGLVQSEFDLFYCANGVPATGGDNTHSSL